MIAMRDLATVEEFTRNFFLAADIPTTEENINKVLASREYCANVLMMLDIPLDKLIHGKDQSLKSRYDRYATAAIDYLGNLDLPDKPTIDELGEIT